MRTAVVTMLFAGGVLLLLVPSVILPVCEYSGFPRMHCSDTALAEYAIGLLCIAGAFALFLLNRPHLVPVVAVAALVLSTAAFFAPDIFGYCASPRMPCHTGTVPAIRAVAAASAASLAGVLISFLRSRTARSGRP